MKRFHHLLKEEVKTYSYRQIGLKAGLPAMSISDYVLFDTEPRLKALERVAAYFHEPVAAMLLEQTVHSNYDVEIYCHLAQMDTGEKKRLIEAIKTIRKTP
jgi:hypothetical protein